MKQLLEDSIYFVAADTRFESGKPVASSPKWTLAVLRPVRCAAVIISPDNTAGLPSYATSSRPTWCP